MAPKARASANWRWSERQLLANARQLNGHTQQECADALLGLGADPVGQRTVSAWETSKTGCPKQHNLDAIRLYILEAGIDPEVASDQAASADPLGDDTENANPSSGHHRARDSNFRNAYAERLASGVPLSEWDFRALELLHRREPDA